MMPRILLMTLAIAILTWWLWPRPDQSTHSAIVCHVGGTMTPVFQELARRYQASTGEAIAITSAGSGELMATIELQHHGDLYVCHDPFMDRLMKRGLGINAWRIAELKPVLVVSKDNPKGIHSLADLARPDVRVFLTDLEHSTLGNILPLIFRRAGMDLEELLASKAIPTHRSGSHVANMLLMDACDAALVWQAVAHLRSDNIDVISIDPHLPRPGIDTITSATGKQYQVAPVRVTMIRLACSKRALAAENFVRYVCSAAGKAVLRDYGFDIDASAGHPEYVNTIANPYEDSSCATP